MFEGHQRPRKRYFLFPPAARSYASNAKIANILSLHINYYMEYTFTVVLFASHFNITKARCMYMGLNASLLNAVWMRGLIVFSN